MDSVVERAFNPDTDSGLIYDSFPKGVFYGGISTSAMFNKNLWFKNFYQYIKVLMEVGRITIACLEDDPGHILGYAIIYREPADDRLEFVFVKPHVRKEGIATMLTKGRFTSFNKDNMTKVGKAILESHSHYLGESDEQQGQYV